MALSPSDGSYAPHHATAATAYRGPDWTPLLVAMVVPILLLQVAVIRPNSTQLARMRGQVARLEAKLGELQAMTPAAEHSAGLLAHLGAQEERLADAEAALNRIDRLGRRLVASIDAARKASRGLDGLDALATRVEQQSALLSDANAALATLAAIPAELQSSIDQASRAAPAVSRVRALGERLAEAQQVTDASLERVDELVTAQEELAIESERIATATETLEGLVKLEERLNAPLMAVAASHHRLDSLLRLKDVVLEQTEDLPAAVETFALMVDLQEDYVRASSVFRTLQRLVADLVLLEPSIARVATVVEPMIDRATLGGLPGAELRMVMRELRERRVEALAAAQRPEVEAEEEVASLSGSTVTK